MQAKALLIYSFIDIYPNTLLLSKLIFQFGNFGQQV